MILLSLALLQKFTLELLLSIADTVFFSSSGTGAPCDLNWRGILVQTWLLRSARRSLVDYSFKSATTYLVDQEVGV
jgi:hypothetical protein